MHVRTMHYVHYRQCRLALERLSMNTMNTVTNALTTTVDPRFIELVEALAGQAGNPNPTGTLLATVFRTEALATAGYGTQSPLLAALLTMYSPTDGEKVLDAVDTVRKETGHYHLVFRGTNVAVLPHASPELVEFAKGVLESGAHDARGVCDIAVCVICDDDTGCVEYQDVVRDGGSSPYVGSMWPSTTYRTEAA